MNNLLWIIPAIIVAGVCLFAWLDVKNKPREEEVQRYKERFVIVSSISIAVLLAGYYVLARTEEDWYATLNEQSFELYGYMLTIQHPRAIRFDLKENDEITLTAGLKQNPNTTTALTSTITLTSTDVVFLNPDDPQAPYSQSMTLFTDRLFQQIQIRTASSRDENPVKVYIEQHVLRIDRESQAAFLCRMIKSRLFGDAGLGLAIAFGAFGAGWKLYNDYRQRLENERKERERALRQQREEQIRELRNLFDHDLINWYVTAQTLTQESQNWDEQTRKELEHAVRRFVTQLQSPSTRERLRSILLDASTQSLGREQLNVLLRVLFLAYFKEKRDLLQIYPAQDNDERIVDEFAKRFIIPNSRQERESVSASGQGSAADVTAAPAAPAPNSAATSPDASSASATDDAGRTVSHQSDPKDILGFCNILLTTFNEDVWGIVSTILAPILQNDHSTKKHLQQFASEGKEPFSSFILYEPRIRPFFDSFSLVYKEEDFFLANPPLKLVKEAHTKNEAIWIKSHNMRYNPFRAHEIYIKLTHTRNISEEPSVIVNCNQIDCYVVARNLFTESITQRRMPVTMVLPRIDSKRRDLLLKSVIRDVSFHWINLIARRPDVFLVLAEHQQKMLAEWFRWSYTLTEITYHILRHNTEKQRERKILLRRIEELASSKKQILPTRDTMRAWLTIRPPQIEHMRLIIIDQYRNWSLSERETVVETLDELTRAGVEWALFTSPELGRTVPFGTHVSLKWSEKELSDALNVVVQNAGKPGGLQELFSPEIINDPQYNDLLSRVYKHANGSLDRCLTIFQRALTRHLRVHPGDDPNNPQYLYLNKDDLEDALSDMSL